MTKLFYHDGRTLFITHPVDVRLALQSGQVSMEDPTKRKLLKKKVVKKVQGSENEVKREASKRRGKDPVEVSFGLPGRGK